MATPGKAITVFSSPGETPSERIAITNMPEVLEGVISDDADNALGLGSDDKLYAASGGGGGGLQFMTGTESPVGEVEPDDTDAPAQYYRTTDGFYWNWNIEMQAWVPVPKVYRALLTQSETSAPVATVLENTLGGEITWSRQGTSIYRANSAGLFAANKTFVYCATLGNANSYFGAYITNLDVNYVEIQVITLHIDEAPGNMSFLTGDEDNLHNYPIEVLVYP